MYIKIPEVFLNMLPTPLVVVDPGVEGLNHKLLFINEAFTQHIGWAIDDIPDKEKWWCKAYPDVDYRTVVERQWELAMEDATELAKSHVEMEVNICTKHYGSKRFKISTQLGGSLIEGSYVVLFEPLGDA